MTTRRLKQLLLTVSLLLAAIGCRNRDGDFVPNIRVELTLNLNNPSYQALNLVGGQMFLPNEGYRGIFLYHASFNEFQAFDMACTYQPSQSCAVVGLDTATNLLQCNCCGSRFSFEGQLLRGPAALSLKAYRTLYQPATNTLHVSN